MPTFKLTLAYDGTDFIGWQRQASGRSIQGLLEDALRDLDGGDVAVTGAGRTDAGVHALGQVAGVTLRRAIDAASLVRAVNARLPEAVRALEASEVAETFHARFQARAKTYRYRVWNAEVLSPFERHYAWHIPAPRLDVDAMAAAALLFEGRHDLAAMQAAGGDVQTTERVVFASRVADEIAGAARHAVDHVRDLGQRFSAPHGAQHHWDAGRGWPRTISRRVGSRGPGVERPRTRRPDGAGAGVVPCACGVRIVSRTTEHRAESRASHGWCKRPTHDSAC